MCGIIGYAGHRNVIPILLEGLKRLEYRGYDSAGIAFFHGKNLEVCRARGKLANLVGAVEGANGHARGVGLGHTRWATHGPPSERNAHPHCDCSGKVVVVHNGIVENYYALRENLIAKGHRFSSDTDTEVLAHLIEENLDGDLLAAVGKALKEVRGSYAVAVMWDQAPEEIVAARKESPLVIGRGDGEVFLASDVPAFLPWTRSAIFLDDGEIVRLRRDRVEVFCSTSGTRKNKPEQTISWDAAMAEKGGFSSFMLKEIYEQPRAILNTIRSRVDPTNGDVFLPEIELTEKEIAKIRKIVFVACGTSYHAGLVARHLLERWIKIPVEVEMGSEFRYRDLCMGKHTLTIPITQSGETADTLASLRRAREVGARVISICNVLGSTATRESDGTIYTHAGPEIGVASTKAFTSQLAALTLLTLFLGQTRRSISPLERFEWINEILDLAAKLEQNIVICHQLIRQISRIFLRKSDFLYLGRNILYPIALEGALKLKEISYIHAEGYPGGEMKHGPIALIDEGLPVVCLAPRDRVYEKMVSNIEEVKSRRGMVIALGEAEDTTLPELADFFIPVPKVSWHLSPIVYAIPLQLLAYEVGMLRGCDVDQPRNLAKSVTVE